MTMFFLGVALGGLVGVIVHRMTRSRLAQRPEGNMHRDSLADGRETDFLSGVLDALTIGVVVVSDSGEVIYRNVRATGITRAAHSEVLVEEAVDNYVRAAIGGQGGRKILDLFGPPRQVISVAALPLPKGGAVAMIEDMTERVLVDAVRTDFVANISHELKTPIGALAILAETLMHEDDVTVVQRLSEKISDEAIRVGRLIDDLLELSRLEYAGEPESETMNVRKILDEAVERSQTLADKARISIEHSDEGSEAIIEGDRRQLVSAVRNLLENAIKYSEPGSKVELSVRTEGSEVLIEIRDHGVGIPAKEIDRIFERFYRVDRARSRETGGTGLGLSIARHIAVNHGGDITVTSVEGSGSTFTLHIPERSVTRT